MRLFFLVSALCIGIISCNGRNSVNVEKPVNFVVRQLELPIDTTINNIESWQGKLVCLLDNGSIAVLDTDYKRLTHLERLVNTGKIDYMFSLGDTVFIANKKSSYYIDTSFRRRKYVRNRVLYGQRIYEDSAYYIYACCAGEFGGSVFFRNKKDDKFYSYYATCARQVVKFKGQYVICNNLAHMSGSMDFLFVKDPLKLFELSDSKQRNHCNWYSEIDSLNVDWAKRPRRGTRSYDGPYGAMSLLSFVVGDSLYSVLSNENSTFIAVHRGDTISERQTIMNNRLRFHYTHVIQPEKRQISLYKQTGGDPFQALTDLGSSSGLIVADSNRVDILRIREKGN
jgi:hypothetical protein